MFMYVSDNTRVINGLLCVLLMSLDPLLYAVDNQMVPKKNHSIIPGDAFLFSEANLPFSFEELRQEKDIMVACDALGKKAISSDEKGITCFNLITNKNNYMGLIKKEAEEERDFEVNSIACNEDGSILVLGGDNNRIAVVDLNKKAIKNLYGHKDSSGMKVSCDASGIKIVTASFFSDLLDTHPHHIVLWDTKKNTVNKLFYEKEFSAAKNRGVWSVACNAAGTRAFSAGKDGTLRVWDLVALKALHILPHGAAVLSVSCDASGMTGVSTTSDQIIRIWNFEEGICLNEFRDSKTQAMATACDKSGRFIVCGHCDGTMRIYDLIKRLWYTLKGHNDVILSVACNGDGSTVLSGDHRGKLLKWCIHLFDEESPK